MLVRTLLLASAVLAVLPAASAFANDDPPTTSSASEVVRYRTAIVDGTEIFYREAGPKDAPALLLLHGFPTSSQMFRNLISSLADKYHVIAPDYPGFGHSGAPDRAKFAYTFDH